MTKQRKKIAPNQMTFDFDSPIEAYTRLRDELLQTPGPVCTGETYEELCIETAAALKRAVRSSGMSREAVVDAINKFFGRPKDKRKCLTLSMFNHYLSKPTKYPIPAIYIVAIQRVCRSLEPTIYMAELEGGKVISGDEVRKLALGKLDDAIAELKRLKRECQGGRKA
jgi:hypothetical protein